MKDFLLIFFTIFITTGLIYFLYKIMLTAMSDNKDEDLQITSREILAQLNILYKQKKYNIVESSAKKYLEKKSNDTGVRTILAKTLFASGRIYEATEQAKILIKQQPNNLDGLLFLANCYHKSENEIKAINLYEDILEKYPDNVIAIKELAKVYYNTNQKKSALKMFQRLDDFIENNAERKNNRIRIAEIYIEYQDYNTAIAEYESILEIYPNDIMIERRLIELYSLTANYYALIELAHQIMNIYITEENGLWAMNELMAVYNLINEYDNALEMADLISKHPLSDKIQAGEDTAKILLEKGQIDESIQLLRDLIEKDPNNIDLKKTFAYAHQRKYDFHSAVNIYKNILDIAPIKDIKQIHSEISSLYSLWAMHLFKQDNIDESFKLFSTSLQYDNQNPEIYYQIGNANLMIKNYNEAMSQFKKAIDLQPKNALYHWALAECYEKIDSVYEQKKALCDGLEYSKDNPEIYYKLGLIYESQHDINSAISNIVQALEIDDNYVLAKHKLALLYEHIGNIDEAIILYEEILDLEPENQDIANNLKMIKS